MQYMVGVRERHVATVLVEANSKEAAIEAVQEGEGDHVMTEYADTMDVDSWSVEEVDA